MPDSNDERFHGGGGSAQDTGILLSSAAEASICKLPIVRTAGPLNLPPHGSKVWEDKGLATVLRELDH